MRRFCAVLFVSVVFAMIAPAAPVPNRAEQAPVYYYPMTVGAKWVYDKPDGDLVLVVSKVENRQGMTVVSVESVENNQRFPFETIEVSTKGLVRTRCRAGELETPVVLLKTPFKPRDAWDFEDLGSAITIPQKGRCVVDVDSVRVPAGTFTAVRVDKDCTTTVGERMVREKISYWYAPNVGLVRMVDNDRKNTWLLLKSFTPGKK